MPRRGDSRRRRVRSTAIGVLAALGLAGAPTISAGAGEADLLTAVRAGDVSGVARLLEDRDGAAGLDVNAVEPDGTTALHWATRTGNVDLVELLVRAGADLDRANRYGVSALSLAARLGQATVLEHLLDGGADPRAAEQALAEGQTLAMLAARAGSVPVLRMLASHDAVKVLARDTRNETTAVMWAALANRADAVRVLVDLGADPNARSRVTDYPHLPAGVLKTPLEEGVSFVGQTPLQRGGWTALMYAARQGSVEAIRALADVGAAVNAVDPLGASALTLAVINGHWDAMDALLEAGADPNVADQVGMTPLYAAVDFHTLPDTYGRPAPKPSVVAGSVEAVRRLLDAGSDPDATLSDRTLHRQYTAGNGRLRAGATALMRAAARGDVTMMERLVEGGASAAPVQANGTSALHLAAASAQGVVGDPDYVPVDQAIAAVRLCLEAGADVNAIGDRGSTAVHAAVGRPGAATMIAFLASQGARVDVEDERGRTPLVLARDARAPDPDTIEILERLSAPSGTTN